MSNRKKFWVEIALGEDNFREEIVRENGEGSDRDVHDFDTEAELDAFLYGLDVCNGYLEYEITDAHDPTIAN